jgi:hypothetical protein
MRIAEGKSTPAAFRAGHMRMRAMPKKCRRSTAGLDNAAAVINPEDSDRKFVLARSTDRTVRWTREMPDTL